MEKPLQILLVDDESAPRKKLRELINNFSSGFKIIGEADNAQLGIKLIKKLNPDILITDIEMPGGSGFELLDCITNKNISVIFISSFNNNAVKAFRYNAVDYLLKPIDIENLLAALDKAREKIFRSLVASRQSVERQNKPPLRLAIHSQNETEFIEIKSIIRLEAEGCYTNIFLKGGRKIIVSKLIGEYEQLLLKEQFVRVHNSHLVNLNFITKFIKKDGLILQMDDGSYVPIAVRRKDVFESRIKLLAI